MPIVPLLLPVSLAALARLRLSGHSQRTLLAVLAIASLVLTMDAALVLRSGRATTAALSNRLEELAYGEPPGEPLVVVSSGTHLGRHAWRTISDIDYFLIPEDRFADYMERFAEDGPTRFAVVGPWTDQRDALFQSLGYVREPGPDELFVVVMRVDDL